MNKTELIAAIAEKAELTKKDSDAAVNAIFETISVALAGGDKVQLAGFGTFEVRERLPAPAATHRRKRRLRSPLPVLLLSRQARR